MYKRDSGSACVCASILGTTLRRTDDEDEDEDESKDDDGMAGAALMGE